MFDLIGINATALQPLECDEVEALSRGTELQTLTEKICLVLCLV